MKEPSDRDQLNYQIVKKIIKQIETNPSTLNIKPMYFKFLEPFPMLSVGLWQNGTRPSTLSSVEIQVIDFKKKPTTPASNIRYAREFPRSSALQFQLVTALPSSENKTVQYSISPRPTIPMGSPLLLDMLFFEQIDNNKKVSPLDLGHYQLQITFITDDGRHVSSDPLCLINETTSLIPCAGLPGRQLWNQAFDWTFPGFTSQTMRHINDFNSWQEVPMEHLYWGKQSQQNIVQ